MVTDTHSHRPLICLREVVSHLVARRDGGSSSAPASILSWPEASLLAL